MDKWECSNCGYIYDPEEGDPENDIEPGTDFDDLPDDWVCPDCDSGQEQFDPIQNDFGDDDDDDDEDYDEDDEDDDDED